VSICSQLSRKQSNKLYLDVLEEKDAKSLRQLCQQDLFFLLTVACKRIDIDREWLYQRCREVEANANGYLDLWAREHYKSTIITFGKTIQDILCNPDLTVGIFSHTRPIAKAFLDQIKREFETNDFLKKLFSDILYEFPTRESQKWSLDAGIIVKRKTNPKECTIEAWGLVDGQPTGKHFNLLVYDDVVTIASVTTPEQIQKTTDALALSYNLGSDGGRRRFIGTRYHYNDTYRAIIERKTVIVRTHAATDNGLVTGNPVLFSQKDLLQKYNDMGVYVFSCQMLQNPSADKAMGFKKEWLNHYDRISNTECWNYYILVDPAGEKKKGSDYTVMLVIATAHDNSYYLIDAIRARYNLSERTDKLFELVKKYNPIRVGYEKYGLQSDIEHIKYVQEQYNYRFNIVALSGQISKNDRIRSLVPIFQNNRMWFPHTLYYIDHENKQKDFIDEFIRLEYDAFPVCVHDDMLDCLARITDEKFGIEFPNFEQLTSNNDIYTAKTDYDVLIG